MKPAGIIGIILIVVGIIALAYGGFSFKEHKKDVDTFYAVGSAAAYQSEISRHYHRRLLKNRDKLFTFLDHDGVPVLAQHDLGRLDLRLASRYVVWCSSATWSTIILHRGLTGWASSMVIGGLSPRSCPREP
jgi:hypothetical protein